MLFIFFTDTDAHMFAKCGGHEGVHERWTIAHPKIDDIKSKYMM
jgi:hypothetical protein